MKELLRRRTLMQERQHARWLLRVTHALTGPWSSTRAEAADPIREQEERLALAVIDRTLTWALREGEDPIVWARRECMRRAAGRAKTGPATVPEVH